MPETMTPSEVRDRAYDKLYELLQLRDDTKKLLNNIESDTSIAKTIMEIRMLEIENLIDGLIIRMPALLKHL